jgi:hypothetical protein
MYCLGIDEPADAERVFGALAENGVGRSGLGPRAGYQDSTPPNNHPYRKRVYFYDCDGLGGQLKTGN